MVVHERGTSFRRSLFHFVFVITAIVISAFVTQFALYQIPLEKHLYAQLEELKDYEFKWHQITWKFRRGLLPVVAIQIDRLEMSEVACPQRRLVAQQLLLPISFMSLLKGEPKLGKVHVDYLDVNLPNCLRAQTAAGPALAREKPKPKDLSPKNSDPFSQALNKVKSLKWTQVKSVLDGVVLPRVVVQAVVEGEDLHLESSLNINFQRFPRLELKLQKLAWANRPLPLESGQSVIVVEDEQINIEILAPLREGKLQLSSVLPLLEPQKEAQINLELKRVPLSYLAESLSSSVPLSYLWLDCQLNLSGLVKNLNKTQIVAEACGVKGPHGEVTVEDFKANLSSLQRLTLKVSDLNLDQVIRNRRDAYLSGVLSRFGILNGSLNYQGEQFELTGVLEEMEVIFSQQSRRDLQKVNRLQFQAKGVRDDWQALVDDINLEQGEWKGSLRILKKSQSDPIYAQLDVSQLNFNPKIYRLLFLAEPAPLSLYGKGEWTQGKLQNWSAVAAMPYLRGDNYKLEQLKVKAEQSEEGFGEVEVRVSTGEVVRGNPLLSWLQPTTLDEKWAEQNLGFRELSVRLHLLDKDIHWKRGYARLNNGWQLTSEGVRNSQREMLAWLQWDRSDQKVMRWDFKGPLFGGGWTPENVWLKDWLIEHPQYLESSRQIKIAPEERGV